MAWKIAALIALGALAASCRPLPEQGTRAEQLYAQRCGQCHHAYNPGSMTAAMWAVQVNMMDAKMEQAGISPLSAQEREQIMAYLKRNAER